MHIKESRDVYMCIKPSVCERKQKHERERERKCEYKRKDENEYIY